MMTLPHTRCINSTKCCFHFFSNLGPLVTSRPSRGCWGLRPRGSTPAAESLEAPVPGVQPMPHAFQAILQGVLECTTAPIYIPPEILKFLGKSFKAWNIVIPMLERRFLALERSRARKHDGGSTFEHVCASLSEQYRLLMEEDLVIGAWRTHGITAQLQRVYSLEQCGQWQAAQETSRIFLDSYFKGWVVDTPGGAGHLPSAPLPLGMLPGAVGAAG